MFIASPLKLMKRILKMKINLIIILCTINLTCFSAHPTKHSDFLKRDVCPLRVAAKSIVTRPVPPAIARQITETGIKNFRIYAVPPEQEARDFEGERKLEFKDVPYVQNDTIHSFAKRVARVFGRDRTHSVITPYTIILPTGHFLFMELAGLQKLNSDFLNPLDLSDPKIIDWRVARTCVRVDEKIYPKVQFFYGTISTREILAKRNKRKL